MRPVQTHFTIVAEGVSVFFRVYGLHTGLRTIVLRGCSRTAGFSAYGERLASFRVCQGCWLML